MISGLRAAAALKDESLKPSVTTPERAGSQHEGAAGGDRGAEGDWISEAWLTRRSRGPVQPSAPRDWSRLRRRRRMRRPGGAAAAAPAARVGRGAATRRRAHSGSRRQDDAPPRRPVARLRPGPRRRACRPRRRATRDPRRHLAAADTPRVDGPRVGRVLGGVGGRARGDRPLHVPQRAQRAAAAVQGRLPERVRHGRRRAVEGEVRRLDRAHAGRHRAARAAASTR